MLRALGLPCKSSIGCGATASAGEQATSQQLTLQKITSSRLGERKRVKPCTGGLTSFASCSAFTLRISFRIIFFIGMHLSAAGTSANELSPLSASESEAHKKRSMRQNPPVNSTAHVFEK